VGTVHHFMSTTNSCTGPTWLLLEKKQ